EERLAALARGAQIPVEPELTQFARSRRAGILLVCGGLGFMAMFAVIAKVVGEPQALAAAAFGILPLAVGIGYFLDAALMHRELKASWGFASVPRGSAGVSLAEDEHARSRRAVSLRCG